MTLRHDAVIQNSVQASPDQMAANIRAVNDLSNRVIQTPDEMRSVAPLSSHRQITNETVEMLQGDVNRAITTATGFTPYILEKPAKVIFPTDTPLLRMTPRILGQGGPVEHWIAVTSVFNGGGPFSLAHLGATGDGSTTLDQPTYNLSNYQNTYQTIALYNSVTLQAQWRTRALEGDLLARRRLELLYALKLTEENWLINGSSKLWAPAPPLLTASTTGGSLAAGTYWYIITAVNANGETLGSTIKTAVVASGTTGSVSITFSGVPFAASYNIYAAVNSTQPANSAIFKQVAADFVGSALPVQPSDPMSMSITAVHTTLQASGTAYSTIVSAGNTATTVLISGQAAMFDGAQSLLYQNALVGSPASVGEAGESAVIIQPAATTGLLALSDLQTLFRRMYSYARANPTHLFVSPVEGVTLDNLIGTASNYRIVADPNDSKSVGNLMAGQKVTQILNQVTGGVVNVVTLPYLPQGTIMAASFDTPYPMPGLDMAPFRVMVNQDYYSLDYPATQANPQQIGFGDFVDETLVNQYIGGWGLINGIQPSN